MPEKKEIDLALVLGGHVNGYTIIKELYDSDIKNIALIDYGKSIARFSNKIKWARKIEKKTESLLSELLKLRHKYSTVVLFPTDDFHLESILLINEQIKDFCYIPANLSKLAFSLDKTNQYNICDKLGIPYPKSFEITSKSDLLNIAKLNFPLIIKPTTRKDLEISVFRTLYLKDFNAFENSQVHLVDYLEQGISFIVSEYIPGDDTNLYAYTCFRSNDGHIINDWSGKKLTQYPDNYGVVSSASNEADEVVKLLGKKLVEGLDAFGVIEPEFKYDARDQQYKLMEVNLRSMMWHRVGTVSGVKLHETMFNFAVGLPTVKYNQEKEHKVHLVLMLHEIPNLLARKGYWKFFKHNIFGGDIRGWAIFEKSDIKPFIFSLVILSKLVVLACLKRLNLK